MGLNVNFLNGLSTTYVPNNNNTQRTNSSSSLNFFTENVPENGKDSFVKNSDFNFTQTRATNPLQSQNQFSSQQLFKNYATENYVNFLIKANPELQEILAANNINGVVNIKNLTSIYDSHLSTTNNYAQLIAEELGLSQAEKQLLEQASTFHDFGKALIPDEIINKPGRFTQEEREIMDLHSELGYQLLKNTKLTTRVLNIIRNHHKPATENNDILGQIISVADVYSALREERVYKTPLSEAESIAILEEKASKGELNPDIVEALKSTLTQQAAAA